MFSLISYKKSIGQIYSLKLIIITIHHWVTIVNGYTIRGQLVTKYKISVAVNYILSLEKAQKAR